MKKLLVLIMVLAISTSASNAASFWSSLRNAFRQDVKSTKQAIRADIETSKKEQAEAVAARKRKRPMQPSTKRWW